MSLRYVFSVSTSRALSLNLSLSLRVILSFAVVCGLAGDSIYYYVGQARPGTLRHSLCVYVVAHEVRLARGAAQNVRRKLMKRRNKIKKLN